MPFTNDYAELYAMNSRDPMVNAVLYLLQVAGYPEGAELAGKIRAEYLGGKVPKENP